MHTSFATTVSTAASLSPSVDRITIPTRALEVGVPEIRAPRFVGRNAMGFAEDVTVFIMAATNCAM